MSGSRAQGVLACLAGLAGRRPKSAAAALAELVHRRGLERRARCAKWFPSVFWVLVECAGGPTFRALHFLATTGTR
jgi:hypothetical protein